MPDRILPTIGAISGLSAGVVAQLPVSPGSLEALAQWPATVVLGAVCVGCVYLGFTAFTKSSKDFSDKLLAMITGEREATEKRTADAMRVTRELAECNAKTAREQAEGHAREMSMVIDKIVKKE